MKRIKRLSLLLLILVFGFILGGCTCKPDNGNGGNGTTPVGSVTLDFYSLNDFHGAMFNDGKGAPGFAAISHYLKSLNQEKSIILSAGDMFQGTALSSMTRGRVVVEAMNEAGFVAMALGNHEFDWGEEHIARYVDGEQENGEADFAFLGANIKDLRTGELASFVKPYHIVEKSGVKIGIIGLIGLGLESDISRNFVENFQFTSELEAIKLYAPILRGEHECEIVVVSVHNDTSPINEAIANLSGNQRVDLVFNGHTHYYYAAEQRRSNDVPLAIVQSGSSGRYVGKIQVVYDRDNKKVTDISAENIKTATFSKEDQKILDLYQNYQDVIDISEEVLGQAKVDIYREEATTWAVNVLQKTADTDFAIINTGGIRRDAFPIRANTDVLYDNIFRIMPFENTIIKTNLTGSQIKGLRGSNPMAIRDGLNYDTLVDDELYTIATIDYLFYKDYRLETGANPDFTGDLFRDYLVAAVKQSVLENGYWIL
ncbi:MAG TPA: bifunctional UDP-sugar hydrolase/5'-nucleotidase [Bacilli bacterium]|nr:bifunctional UDP-sugar hydrolase/5'-nucleotidase [Bacilli bacterium]